ncbi:hypothetical protein ACQJBY_049645 [Aegilops geniculata]|uniref:CBS domain-containing protein n=1 Tax=Triticum turgidum subsp. durum TaxID=4567 RepID=A0A9R0X9F2_TRITD|nr:unnamed protein product [Triticum turgidum subsp. durum]
MPESTTVLEACRRMAARRVDAALLTDSNALLCGILTDKDIATRVIAREVRMDETPVWKVMTRHPVFVLSDTLAVEALQKMVQGKFRHLPVVENGEVMAMLDIAKCLYDAIARMERASEKGKAVIDGTDKVVIAAPGDSVLAATKMMVEAHANSAVVAVGNKPRGILTSRDILMRMIARNLPADSTPVEKVMTLDPECATVDTPILDALRTMQERKFLHLPVMDRDGSIVCIVDVIDITHAAISIVESSGTGDEATISMIQRFWDSAMALGSMDDETETQSLMSDATRSQIFFEKEAARSQMMSEVIHEAAEPPYPALFSFKLQDRRGRMHRFSCEVQSLTPLVTCILQRLGTDIDRHRLPQILGLKLFLDYSGGTPGRRSLASNNGTTTMDLASREAWSAAYGGVAAGAALVTGLGVMVYLRRAG